MSGNSEAMLKDSSCILGITILFAFYICIVLLPGAA